MKKALKILMFLVFSVIAMNAVALKKLNIDQQYKEFRHTLVVETINYYRNHGAGTKKFKNISAYADSAIRVSRMFTVYPARNTHDRANKFFNFGSVESGFERNLAVANIPGATYLGGKMHVNKFSVDYSWVGINSCNIERTYKIAYRIQNHLSLAHLGLSLKCVRMFRQCNIPEGICLAKINLDSYWDTRNKWIEMKRCGQTPNYIRGNIGHIEYSEDTQDQIDSALIYRVIIEMERMCNGWSYQTYGKGLYNWLDQFVD